MFIFGRIKQNQVKRINDYFISELLGKTDDAFEHARIHFMLRLAFIFTILFSFPVIFDYVLGYEKAVVLHSMGLVGIILMPWIIKKQQNIDKTINLFFSIGFFVELGTTMMINPEKIDPMVISWAMFFMILSALLQRGKVRLLFSCFLFWVPIIYLILNISLKGQLNVKWIIQEGAENPPIFLMFFPIILSIYSIWSHTITISEAQQTISEQKQIIEEKNKDIIDSIRYAKRIQNSLLPTDKYIEKSFKRLKDK